ncbi:cohesin domain-containing protein [Halovenus salina]|uniref:Cohesin domain-containing protein n=1 Tax=Halovenus salina TaxID=1510225 RepID=A0ABD5VV42_9EURY|nr:hypothetical protein [Halovenus salina]
MDRSTVPLVVVGCLFALAVTGAAVGSDQPTIVYPEHEQQTVAPGETVDVRVFVESDGGYGDIGLTNLTLGVSYEREILSVTDIETASYLEQGPETEVYDETSIDDESGTAVAHQWRDPPRNGSTGIAQFATVTLEVAENAPETNTTLSFVDSRAELAGDYEVFVYEHNATLRIENNGDTAGAVATEESPADSGPPVIAVGVVGVATVGGLALFVGRRYRS